jgi:transposase-like protein
MSKQTRRNFNADFKSKVVLEALKERSSIEELAKKHELHPNQIHTWKKEFLSKVSMIFDDKSKPLDKAKEDETTQLYATIGQQKIEIDFLKKKLS